MFLFLASLACVAAAETGTNAPCQDSKQSPHLTQRAWVDGDRHCSYRDNVVFESHTREFDRIVGPSPKATALITGEAMALSAHEGAVFLEHGAEGEAAGPRRVEAFTVVKKRILTNRRLIHVADTGIPDGIKVDARGRLYVGCGDGVHVLSRDGELLGKIKLPGKDPAANLAFGKGKHRSTLYVLDETSVTAVELPGTRGARVGRERKFDVGRARYKSI